MILRRPVDPDPEWEKRTRFKCHMEIARRYAKRGQRKGWMTLLDAAAAATLGAYLMTVIREAGLL